MNFLKSGFSFLSNVVSLSARQCLNVAPIQQSRLLSPILPRIFLERFKSLEAMHRDQHWIYKKPKKRPLDGRPFMKGIVLKTLIKKPKKPNSANRKCVLVRLSNGKEMVAHVPGIGHNLQEHNTVLVRCGRLKDCPGVKIKCVRGKYDLPPVIKTDTSIKKS